MAELWEGQQEMLVTLGWAPQGWGVAGLSVGTPGRAECGTQQGPGAETCWWDLGLWRAVPGRPCIPQGVSPPAPHRVPTPVALQGGLGTSPEVQQGSGDTWDQAALVSEPECAG